MTHYIYDLGGNLIAEADGGTGAVTAEYVALEGKPLAWIATAAIYWVHGDHLGTPQMLTDASGAVVWDADYRPFGAATVTGALTFNLRFPGQYEDAETGLHYNTFRDYDARLGRYIQSDPIGLGGGWNTYGYVGGNPVMRVDPEGLFQMCPPGSRDDGADYLQPGCGAGPETWGGPKGGGGRRKQPDKPPAPNQDPKPGNESKPQPPLPPVPPPPEKCDDDNDCQERLSDWKIKNAGIDPHALKHEYLGRRAQVSLYELCKCKDGTVAIRLKGCTGPITKTWAKVQ